MILRIQIRRIPIHIQAMTTLSTGGEGNDGLRLLALPARPLLTLDNHETV